MSAVSAQSYRLQQRVASFLEAERVVEPGERVLLMLSGGADSMVMLELLLRLNRRLALGLTFAALHVDYGMRGARSTRDREIVERGCAAAGVELHVVRLEGALAGANFQARAREVRYRRAQELAEEYGYSAVATAHNRDDQAETVLYRLVKYATPRGLVGMRPREGRLAKPLLCLGAAEVRAFCVREGIAYGEDESNERVVYARNALRHEVLPLLERINPRCAQTLADGALLAAAEADFVAAAVEEARRRVRAELHEGDVVALDLDALAAEPPALRDLLVRDAVKGALGGEALVSRRTVGALRRLCERREGGGRLSLRGGLEAAREGRRLVLRAAAELAAAEAVEVSCPALLGAGAEGLRVCVSGRIYRLRLFAEPVFDRSAALAGEGFLGFERPPRRLVLRPRRVGDRFAPSGLGASTTVARYLAAAGVSPAVRSLAVLLEADGVVGWVGHPEAHGFRSRVAQVCRVDQSTQSTLHIALED